LRGFTAALNKNKFAHVSRRTGGGKIRRV